MKRFRDVVFSTTEPTDKNVIWVYPVTDLSDNDLYDQKLPVSTFDGKLYKVLIWNECWENLFYGPLTYIKSQILDYVKAQIGEIPEGTTLIEILNAQESQLNGLSENVLYLNERVEGLVSSKVDKVEGYDLSSNDFTDSYKNLLDTLFDGFMTFKTIVESYSKLPSSATNGDVYLVGTKIPYYGYIWSDVTNSFLPLGPIADLSNFYTKAETYTKTEVETYVISQISSHSIVQKASPQGAGYWRGGSMYPLLVDPQADQSQNVILGESNRGVINFYEMHNFLQYQFDAATYFTTKLLLGGKRDITKLDGIISLYNKTTERYNHLKAGSGTSSTSSDLTYFLPSPETDGGSKILATTAEATTSKAGLMSAEDKTKLDNIDNNGNIPIGGIIMWSGETVPNGWALCNGQNGTPNLQGRFILGSGHYTEEGRNFNYEIGPRDDGQVSVKLTAQQSGLPSHTHKVNIQHATGSTGGDTNSLIQRKKTADTNYNSSVPYIGSTEYANGRPALQAHNNMPPYYVLAFIMRIA